MLFFQWHYNSEHASESEARVLAPAAPALWSQLINWRLTFHSPVLWWPREVPAILCSPAMRIIWEVETVRGIKQRGLHPCTLVRTQTSLNHPALLSHSVLNFSESSDEFLLLSLQNILVVSLWHSRRMLLLRFPVTILAEVVLPVRIEGSPPCFVRQTLIRL